MALTPLLRSRPVLHCYRNLTSCSSIITELSVISNIIQPPPHLSDGEYSITIPLPYECSSLQPSYLLPYLYSTSEHTPPLLYKLAELTLPRYKDLTQLHSLTLTLNNIFLLFHPQLIDIALRHITPPHYQTLGKSIHYHPPTHPRPPTFNYSYYLTPLFY